MDAEAMLAQLNQQAASASPIGATLKMEIDELIVYIDGTGDANVISQDDKEADCVITASKETMLALSSGDLNPMMAVMGGKIKIKGDMGVATKLQSLMG